MVRQSRREKPLGPTVWLPLVLILVSILLTARADVAYSPPGIVHACAAVFMTSMVAGEKLRKQLYTFVLLVAVAVIVRPVLEVVGASAPTVFLGDDLRTLSFRSSMPLPSIAYVHTLFIALFFAAVLYTAVLGRVMRFVIVRGRRQLYLLLWQLHQILPNAKLRLGSIRPTGPGDPRSLIERLLQ
jgi:hypothetical protein